MKRNTIALVFLGVTIVFAMLFSLLRNYTFSLFQPEGIIATEERGLIIHAVLLMLIVVIPVFILAFTIAWRYRDGNKNAAYTPDWENSPMEELIWWAVPLEIVLVLGALTWSSTHQLDPSKQLPGQAPLVIEVVALDWKWLFMYPSLGIATVDQVDFPVNRPVEFEITADAPMNSFWIPQLGGQIYAMTGMTTQLHLEADKIGTYRGSSANYSGDGFASMQFAANATSESDFDSWVAEVKQGAPLLDEAGYEALAKPSTTTPQTYVLSGNTLYNSIVMKFMRSPSITGDTDH